MNEKKVMSKFWFHKLLCRLNYEDRRICNFIIGQLVLKHCVLWNYENIEMTKNHRHLINIDCLLTQPACLAFVDSSSYVANHHKTRFSTVCSVCILISPLHALPRLLYSGWPTNYGQWAVYFFRCLCLEPKHIESSCL